MKKTIGWALVSLFSITPFASAQDKVAKYTTPFYPLEKGSQWVYRQDSGRVTITVVDHKVVDLKEPIIGPKEKISQVVAANLKIVSGERQIIEKVAVLPDGVYRVAAAGQELTPPVCFLKLQKVGENWKIQSSAEGLEVQGTFTSAKANVKVPAGSFAGIKVSCDNLQVGEQKMAVDYWFSQGVGMVKQKVVMNPGEGNERIIVLELESVKLAK